MTPAVARRRRDAGYATVWATAWITCCVSIGWLVLVVAFTVARQHRVDGAAELAALSAAAARSNGGDPCDTAGVIAVANRVELTSCRVEGDDVVIEVTATVPLPWQLDGRLTARARAGPASA